MRDAPLAPVALRGPGDSVGEGQAHRLALEVHDRVDDVPTVLERSGKPAHVRRGVPGIETRQEDGRTEGVGESRDVVVERIAGRQLVGGVELEGEPPGHDRRHLSAVARRRTVTGGGGRAGPARGKRGGGQQCEEPRGLRPDPAGSGPRPAHQPPVSTGTATIEPYSVHEPS